MRSFKEKWELRDSIKELIRELLVLVIMISSTYIKIRIDDLA